MLPAHIVKQAFKKARDHVALNAAGVGRALGGMLARVPPSELSDVLNLMQSAHDANTARLSIPEVTRARLTWPRRRGEAAACTHAALLTPHSTTTVRNIPAFQERQGDFIEAVVELAVRTAKPDVLEAVAAFVVRRAPRQTRQTIPPRSLRALTGCAPPFLPARASVHPFRAVGPAADPVGVVRSALGTRADASAESLLMLVTVRDSCGGKQGHPPLH